MSTVQLSADVPVKVVVNCPTLMMIKRPTLWPRAKPESLAMTMASGEARILSCSGQDLTILKYCLTLV